MNEQNGCHINSSKINNRTQTIDSVFSSQHVLQFFRRDALIVAITLSFDKFGNSDGEILRTVRPIEYKRPANYSNSISRFNMKFLAVVFVCIAVVSAVKPRFSSKFQRQVVPHTIYGPPPQEYGPPSQEYGPPEQETTTAGQEEVTTTEMPTTTEAESELVNSTARPSRLTQGGERGVYYIYHPTGQLQKVIYSTKKDPRNRAYTAQVKYEDVEPIKAPIFTYDPKTLILSRLQP